MSNTSCKLDSLAISLTKLSAAAPVSLSSINLLQNDELSFEISPGTESGRILSFPGKGIPIIQPDGHANSRGSLYIKVNVKIPKSITEEERNLYRELDKFY